MLQKIKKSSSFLHNWRGFEGARPARGELSMRRHWYQWVPGFIGDVDNVTTDWLYRGKLLIGCDGSDVM
jgi:hypothetical protein